LDAKVSWFADDGLYIATRHGLAYPSLLLNLLAKEGALGLLPADTDVPEGVIIDSDALVTMTVAPSHWVTAELGFSETVFVHRSESGTASATIYTPAVELPFAGHPTGMTKRGGSASFRPNPLPRPESRIHDS